MIWHLLTCFPPMIALIRISIWFSKLSSVGSIASYIAIIIFLSLFLKIECPEELFLSMIIAQLFWDLSCKIVLFPGSELNLYSSFPPHIHGMSSQHAQSCCSGTQVYPKIIYFLSLTGKVVFHTLSSIFLFPF